MQQADELPSLIVAKDVIAPAEVEALSRVVLETTGRTMNVVHRERPMLGLPDLPQAVALILLFNPASVAFLAELGKDAYRGFRSALFAAYEAVIERNAQPIYSPFAIQCGSSVFVFHKGHSEDEFERGVAELAVKYSGFSGGDSAPGRYAFYKWDDDARSWKFVGGGYFV